MRNSASPSHMQIYLNRSNYLKHILKLRQIASPKKQNEFKPSTVIKVSQSVPIQINTMKKHRVKNIKTDIPQDSNKNKYEHITSHIDQRNPQQIKYIDSLKKRISRYVMDGKNKKTLLKNQLSLPEIKDKTPKHEKLQPKIFGQSSQILDHKESRRLHTEHTMKSKNSHSKKLKDQLLQIIMRNKKKIEDKYVTKPHQNSRRQRYICQESVNRLKKEENINILKNQESANKGKNNEDKASQNIVNL